MNSSEYLLKQVDWQWFMTFTWNDTNLGSIYTRENNVDKFLRRYAAHEQVSLSDLPMVTRWERGEMTQRPHCHVLLTGLPNVSRITKGYGFALMAAWYRRYGLARIRPWHAELRSAVGQYFTKGLDRLDKPHVCGSMTSANEYEIVKFNRADRLVFNQALWAHLQSLTGTAFEVSPST